MGCAGTCAPRDKCNVRYNASRVRPYSRLHRSFAWLLNLNNAGLMGDPCSEPVSRQLRTVGFRLLETWVCKACGRQAPQLIVCLKCRSVRYCSAECQTADMPLHKMTCRSINLIRTAVDYADALLREAGCFETHAGRFAELPGGSEYCKYRLSLAELLDRLARQYPVRPLLEEVLSHRLEVMRLDKVPVTLQETVPFTLLRLGSDDGFLSFIKFWMTVHVGMSSSDDVSRTLHDNSEEGDWPYKEQWTLYGDCFASFEEFCAPKGFGLSTLVAILIFKLRIVARLKATLRTGWQAFTETAFSKMLGDCNDAVWLHYRRVDKWRRTIAEEERLVQKCMTNIHEINKTFLAVTLDVEDFLRSMRSATASSASGTERWDAHDVLIRCDGLITSIPGGRDAIKQFLQAAEYQADLARRAMSPE